MPRRNSNARHALEMLMRGFDHLSMRMMDVGDKDSYFYLREYFMEELLPSLEILCMELEVPMLMEPLRDIRNRIAHGVK